MKKLYIFALLVAFLFTAAVADEDPPPRGKPAIVNIITEPPNSDVYLGNEYLGKSPIINRSVNSGRQNLKVQDQGYDLVSERVNIWPGKDKRNDFNFGTQIPKGTIKITTKPGVCNIFIDGDLVDQTDGGALTVKNMEAGDHVVRAECNNRRSAEDMVRVEGEKVVTIELDASGKKK